MANGFKDGCGKLVKIRGSLLNPLAPAPKSKSPDINSELSNPSIATKVFPNPVIDNLSIESDSPIEKLLIFDVTGKLVADLDVGGAYQFDTLIFSQLPAGKYHLQLLSKEGIDIHNLIKH